MLFDLFVSLMAYSIFDVVMLNYFCTKLLFNIIFIANESALELSGLRVLRRRSSNNDQ